MSHRCILHFKMEGIWILDLEYFVSSFLFYFWLIFVAEDNMLFSKTEKMFLAPMKKMIKLRDAGKFSPQIVRLTLASCFACLKVENNGKWCFPSKGKSTIGFNPISSKQNKHVFIIP